MEEYNLTLLPFLLNVFIDDYISRFNILREIENPIHLHEDHRDDIGGGSKRHSLKAVELSQTDVQIVSNLPAPSNWVPIYRFFIKPAMRTRCMAGAASHKSG